MGTEPPSCAYAGYYSHNKRTAFDEAPPAQAEPIAATAMPARAAAVSGAQAPAVAATAAQSQSVSSTGTSAAAADAGRAAPVAAATHRPKPSAPPVTTLSGDTSSSDSESDRGPNSTPDPLDATPDPKASD
jgi:hypothetical protein